MVDKVRQDLKTFNVPETSWYIKAQESSVWRNLCSEESCSCWWRVLDQVCFYLSALSATASFKDLKILQGTSVLLLNQGLATVNFLHCVG